MTKVRMETKLNTPADTLWKTVGGFNALPNWHPGIAKSETSGEGKDSTRTLSLAGGGSIVERLEEASATDKLYRYSILSGPLPVADYVAEIHVKDNGDGTSTLEWSSEFKPKEAAENDASRPFRGSTKRASTTSRKCLAADGSRFAPPFRSRQASIHEYIGALASHGDAANGLSSPGS